jgi:uncharacterized membrane protein (UPF0127 family)
MEFKVKPFIKPLIIAIVLAISATAVYYYINPLVPKLSINKHIITYELAITPAEIQQGLSGRDPLPENHGMLFVFNHKEQYTFWMKEMKFPLDMLWIEDNTVIDISKNVPIPVPDQTLPLFSPKRPANRVLELNAGTADKLGIKEGDVVTYLKK